MEREEVAKLVQQLKMHNILNEEQKMKLQESIKVLNEDLKIGLHLEFPKRRSCSLLHASPQNKKDK